MLDASALLACLNGEPGGDRVEEALVEGAVIGALNRAEVLSKVVEAELRRQGLSGGLCGSSLCVRRTPCGSVV